MARPRKKKIERPAPEPVAEAVEASAPVVDAAPELVAIAEAGATRAAEIAAEAAPADAVATAEGAGAPAGVIEPPREADAGMVEICGAATQAIGDLICRRAGVDGLTGEEAATIGRALANLLAQYDIAIRDPRVAAWLGMGGAVAAVALPRIKQRRATIDAPAKPAGEPAAADGPEIVAADRWPSAA